MLRRKRKLIRSMFRWSASIFARSKRRRRTRIAARRQIQTFIREPGDLPFATLIFVSTSLRDTLEVARSLRIRVFAVYAEGVRLPAGIPTGGPPAPGDPLRCSLRALECTHCSCLHSPSPAGSPGRRRLYRNVYLEPADNPLLQVQLWQSTVSAWRTADWDRENNPGFLFMRLLPWVIGARCVRDCGVE